MRFSIILGALLLVASTLGFAADLPALTPAEAIDQAKTGRVKGYFEFTVKRTGRDHKSFYLNSEENYRLPTSLNVEIPRGLASDLEEMLGADIDSLVGQRVRIEGVGRRLKIYTGVEKLGDGRAEKRRYYHQTQVRLRDIDRLTVLN